MTDRTDRIGIPDRTDKTDAAGRTGIMDRIYVDNAATTPVSEAALAAMLPCFRGNFGNPSAIYSYGQEAKKVLEDSRSAIAEALGAKSSEIFFTSGGTESDNWALHSVCTQNADKGKHIISTEIEHSAVLRTLEKLQAQGFTVSLLKPDKNGQITPDQLKAAIRGDTVLVSIMMANNVIGTVLRIRELCAAAHERRIVFHTDAVQAAGHIPINVRELNVDLLSLSAHKFHGPKGAGALFARLPRIPAPFVSGGGQERGGRSGTENVPGAAGMAAALRESVRNLPETMPRLTALRDKLIEATLAIPGASLTGDGRERLPGHASFVFAGIEHSAYLINMLNEAGICASSGAACAASSKEAPHVLKAIGVEEDLALCALRVTLSANNTEKEIDSICRKLPDCIARLRQKRKLPFYMSQTRKDEKLREAY